MPRNLNVVMERCVQKDAFKATAAPSVKHSSSAVDVRFHLRFQHASLALISLCFSIPPPTFLVRLQVCSAVSNVIEAWQRLALPSTDTAARECRRAVAQLLMPYCVQQVQQPHLLPFVILVFLKPDMNAAFSLFRQGSSMLPTLFPLSRHLRKRRLPLKPPQATSRTIHFATSP